MKFIFFLLCVFFLLACDKESKDNTGDDSAQIKELQEQIAALSNNSGESNATQIAELQKKITVLSNNSGESNATQIAELQKKIDELSAETETIDGSVSLKCTCFHSPSRPVEKDVRGYGNSKSEAKEDAEETCKKFYPIDDENDVYPANTYVTDCLLSYD